MFPALHMCMDSSIIQYMQELLKEFISLHISFLNLLLPNLLVCPLLVLTTNPGRRLLWPILFAFTYFLQIPPCPGNIPNQAKWWQALALVKTHNHNSLRIRSILLPLTLATCTRNVSCHHHRYYWSGGGDNKAGKMPQHSLQCRNFFLH